MQNQKLQIVWEEGYSEPEGRKVSWGRQCPSRVDQSWWGRYGKGFYHTSLEDLGNQAMAMRIDAVSGYTLAYEVKCEAVPELSMIILISYLSKVMWKIIQNCLMPATSRAAGQIPLSSCCMTVRCGPCS